MQEHLVKLMLEILQEILRDIFLGTHILELDIAQTISGLFILGAITLELFIMPEPTQA